MADIATDLAEVEEQVSAEVVEQEPQQGAVEVSEEAIESEPGDGSAEAGQDADGV